MEVQLFNSENAIESAKPQTGLTEESLCLQTSAVTQLISTETIFRELSTVMKENKNSLKELLSLIPNSCDENCGDKKKINTLYDNFSTSIMAVDKTYQTIPGFLFKFKRYMQHISNLIKNIKLTLQSMVANNSEIDSTKIKEQYKRQLEEAQSQYNDLNDYREKFEQSLEENHVVEMKTAILKSTNIIFQLAYVEDVRDKLEQNLDKLLELKVQLGKAKINKENEQSQLTLLNGQKGDIEAQIKQLNTSRADLIAYHQKQLEEVQNQGKGKMQDNKTLIDEIESQIQEIQSKREVSIDLRVQKTHNLLKFTEAAFQQSTEQIQNITMGSQPSSYIVLLDESGSMKGDVFNQAAKAIQQMVIGLKQSNPNDQFTLIQFDNNARTVINTKQVNSVDETEIGKKFNGGGTNFKEAFQAAADTIPLCGKKNHINIVFFTDGDDSSDCTSVLKKIKKECGNRQLTLFCLGYGLQINQNKLKSCLGTINGNPMTKKLLDGQSVQTLYQVNSIDDIKDVFQKITNQTVASVEEMKKKANMKKEAQEEYQQISAEMSDDLLTFYDTTIQKLMKQKEELFSSFNQVNIEDFLSKLQVIQQEKVDQIDQILSKVESKLQETNNKILNVESQKKQFGEEETNLTQKINEFNKLNFTTTDDDSGSEGKSEAVVKQLKEQIKKTAELGFKSQQHFKDFHGKLEAAEVLSNNVQNFKNNIFLCIDEMDQFLQNIVSSISKMEDNQQEISRNANTYYKSQIIEYLNFHFKEKKDFKQLDTSQVILDFITKSDSRLTQIITNDQELNQLADKVVAKMQNLEEVSYLTNNIIAPKKKEKNAPQEVTVAQYVNQIFLNIYSNELEKPESSPKIEELKKEIQQIEADLENEEDYSKQEKLNKKLEKAQENLLKNEEKLEKYLEEFQEKQEKTLKKNKAKEFELIQRMVSNLNSSLKQLEYRLKQNKIFTPMLILKENIEDVERTGIVIKQLSIAY